MMLRARLKYRRKVLLVRSQLFQAQAPINPLPYVISAQKAAALAKAFSHEAASFHDRMLS
jgi:hypothetical protein